MEWLGEGEELLAFQGDGSTRTDAAVSRPGLSTVVASTDNVARQERFAYWRQVMRKAAIPFDVSHDNKEADFFGKLCRTGLGPVLVSSIVSTPYRVERSPKLIRQFDPEMYQLVVNLRDHAVAMQGEQEAEVGPGDMVLYDSSHPLLVQSKAQGSLHALIVSFPRDVLPLPERMVRNVLAVRLPGNEGIGRVVRRFLTDLAPGVDNGRRAETVHLGEAVLESISALLSCRVGDPIVGSAARRRASLMSIQSFIREHLGDPNLSPKMIADAHFMSVRSLQVLFKSHGLVVAGWIRDQRLDRCRRDLSEPALAGVPASRIGARWGLTDPAHFSRIFRAKYGVPPAQYRVMVQQGEEQSWRS